MRALLKFWPDVRARLGIYTLVTVLTLVANGIALVIPVVTGHIVDGPIAHGDAGGLVGPVLLLIGVVLLEAGALFTRRYLIAPVVSRWEILWRARLFDRLQYTSVASHDAWESGQLLSRAVNDLTQLRRFFAFGAPFIIVLPIVIAIGGGILTASHWVFGLILLAMAIPTVIIIAVFQQRYSLASRRAQDQMGVLTTNVEESIQGLRILRAFGRSPWMKERFRAISHHLADIEVRKAKLDAWMWGSIVVLPQLAQAAVLGVGAWGAVQGWLTVGQVVSAVTIMMVLRIPIEMLGFLLSDFLMSATAATRYWEVMEHPLGIVDPGRDPAGRGETRRSVADEPEVGEWAGRLDFDDVDFAFADAPPGQLTFDGLRLHIEPGETVALVGATGSGKTALAALVPRLQDVTGGAVRIDGRDVRELPINTVRALVSVAFEDPILFSATVRENVVMGAPAASDDDVWAALRIACAEDFVAALPEGLDTQVGEQGMSLSGGQRQRLALARAIIGTPRILILDDPLSAVDVDTEDRVQRGLRTVLPDSTTLVIAHRPSTAALADRVAVLENGRIVAEGSHEDLLHSSEAYRELMGAAPTVTQQIGTQQIGGGE